MRTFLFLCFSTAFSFTPGNTFSQNAKIKIDADKIISVAQIFELIRQQAGYKFVYIDDIIANAPKVELKKGVIIAKELIEKGLSPIGCTFEFTENETVIVKRKNKVVLSTEQQKEISGIITDKNGQPLPGANILEKGTTNGVITDFDGKFTLKVADENAVLVISYLGFITREISVEGKSNFNIKLEEDAGELDEVVIIGYGEQKKASVIGSIEIVKPELLKTPATNLSNSFAGRIAGIISVQRSGEPGADGSSFWIRGISTFAGQTAPLIILDGVEINSRDLNALAPEVIESFSVLKDATATALYGAKGANGVMIIKTKSGKFNEKTKINVRVENRISTPTYIPKLADGVTYMEMYNEAIRTRSSDTNPELKFSQEKIKATESNLDPIAYPNINWYNELFKKTAMNQTVNLNVSGGGKNIAYFISALFNHDQGLFKYFDQNSIETNLSNFRYAFQNNLRAKLTNTTEVGLRVNVQIEDYKRPRASTSNLFTSTIRANPVLFPVFYPNTAEDSYKPDNVLFGNAQGGPTSNRYPNPFADLVTGQREDFRSTVISVFDVNQDLGFVTKGLNTNVLVSFINYSTTSVSKFYVPTYYELTAFNPDDGSNRYDLDIVGIESENSLRSDAGTGGSKTINLQWNINYDKVFGDIHNLSALLVYLQRDFSINDPSSFIQTLHERNQGLAGRLTYDFDNRYFIEGNFGYNGSENFIKGKRFGFFPSVAAGYIVSNEDYFEPLKDYVNLLKIRVSFGKVGNSFVNPRFPYVTEVNNNGSGYTFGEKWNNSNSGPRITKYGNEDATWEVSEKLNIGLELKMFNRISLILEYFNEDRTGIFLQRNTFPSFIGIGNSIPTGNLGVVRNQGVDITLNYDDRISDDFSISFKSTFTYAANELIDRDEPNFEFEYLSALGHPLNSHKVLISKGLFKDQDDVDNSPRQTYTASYKAGDIKYEDLNEDGKIDDNDRKIVENPSVPQILYGFGVSTKYKNWDASVFFQGISKVTNRISDIAPFGALQRNVLGFIAGDYWSEANPNPNAKHPRLDNGDNTNNLQPSSYWLRDGSFLRLKNAEIGYSYKKMRAYISGSNLLTSSIFNLWDPEIGGGNGLGYPPQKVINLGIQFNL